MKNRAPVFLHLGFEVGQVDAIVGVDFHQHRLAAGIVDRPRYRCQGKRIGQHRLTGTNAGRLQCDVQGVAAGGAGQAVALAHIFGELLFENWPPRQFRR